MLYMEKYNPKNVKSQYNNVKSQLLLEYFVLGQTILKKMHVNWLYLFMLLFNEPRLSALFNFVMCHYKIIRSIFNASFEVVTFNLFLKKFFSLSSTPKILKLIQLIRKRAVMKK